MSYPIALETTSNGLKFAFNSDEQTDNLYGWTITKSSQLKKVTNPDLSSLSVSGRFSISLREYGDMSLLVAFKPDEEYMEDETIAKKVIALMQCGEMSLLKSFGLRSQLFFYVVGGCSPHSIVQGMRSICPMLPEWTDLLTSII